MIDTTVAKSIVVYMYNLVSINLILDQATKDTWKCFKKLSKIIVFCPSAIYFCSLRFFFSYFLGWFVFFSVVNLSALSFPSYATISFIHWLSPDPMKRLQSNTTWEDHNAWRKVRGTRKKRKKNSLQWSIRLDSLPRLFLLIFISDFRYWNQIYYWSQIYFRIMPNYVYDINYKINFN